MRLSMRRDAQHFHELANYVEAVFCNGELIKNVLEFDTVKGTVTREDRKGDPLIEYNGEVNIVWRKDALANPPHVTFQIYLESFYKTQKERDNPKLKIQTSQWLAYNQIVRTMKEDKPLRFFGQVLWIKNIELESVEYSQRHICGKTTMKHVEKVVKITLDNGSVIVINNLKEFEDDK